MMLISCRDLAERASDYLDRDLPLRSRLQVRLHLLLCENCRRYLDQLRATVDLVRRSLGQAAMPADSETQLLAAVRARALTDRRR